MLARWGWTNKNRRPTIDDYLRTVLAEDEWKNQGGLAKRLPSERRPSGALDRPALVLGRGQHHGDDGAGLLGLPGPVGLGSGLGPGEVDVDPGAGAVGTGQDS